MLTPACDMPAPAKLQIRFVLASVAVFAFVQASAWVFGWSAIVTAWPGRALTSFNTSVCLLLASVAIELVLSRGSGRAAIAVSAALGVLSVLAALDLVLHTNFALDALVRHTTILSSTTSLYTSFAFGLLSLATGWTSMPSSSRWWFVTGPLAVSASAIGLAGLLAHVLHLIPESESMGLGALSVSTSLGLALLGSALVTLEMARYERGDFYWIAPLTGALAFTVTAVLWQALRTLHQTGELDADVPLMFVVAGLLLSAFATLSSYVALVARHKEHELRELNSVLEAKVRARTSELERSNAELDRFSAMAAHDLKSPVASMTQFAQLLTEEATEQLTTRERHWLSLITQAGERARRLIDSLLECAHVAEVAHHYEQLDGNQLVRAAVENLHYDIQKADADLRIGRLPEVCGDRVQLIRLFQNLVSNAIKFRKADRRPVVEVSAREDASDWCITVEDNGIGIDPKNASRVFEFFTRLHVEQEYPGTGLGLAMCRRIVEHHRGRIWLESRPGQGTRFHFTVPRLGAPESPC